MDAASNVSAFVAALEAFDAIPELRSLDRHRRSIVTGRGIDGLKQRQARFRIIGYFLFAARPDTASPIPRRRAS